MPSIDLSGFPATLIVEASLPLAALGGSAVPVCLFALSKWKTSKHPPGPPGNWIIGNALDVPIGQEWLGWDRLRREYGNIVYLHLFGQSIVLLSDPQMIIHLLEKRSSITSDRPELVVAGKIIGFENSTVGIQHNAKHREARKLFNQTIGRANATKYDTLVEDEMVKLVGRLIKSDGSTKEISSVVRHAVGAVIMAITFAIKVKETNDPYIQYAEDAIIPFNRTAQPGAYFVDIFPTLQYLPSWFPGATYKKDAPEWIQQVRRLLDIPVQVVKDELSHGIYKTSVAHEIYADLNMTKEREEDLKWVTASMYLGGADTTASAIQIFMLAMLRYPEVQRKAQLEIDTVVGTGRFPTLKDRPSLPYIGAILKETLRWHPIAPMAGPHLLTSDEILEGYVIPKGTTIIPNVWSLLHDEQHFSDPMEFTPERFLGPEEKGLHTASLDPWSFVFGFGRRVCPGRDLADIELWLAISSILAALTLGPKGEVPPPAEFTSGAISHPVFFDCNIRTRNERTEAMVNECRRREPQIENIPDYYRVIVCAHSWDPDTLGETRFGEWTTG